MRLFPLIALLLAASLAAADPAAAPAFPLWDGQESVADYAKRANLPPVKTLDLGRTVASELVLIPAGKFLMGTPPPPPVDVKSFDQRIALFVGLLSFCILAMLILGFFVLFRAIRMKRRLQLSLGLLLLATMLAGGCVHCGLQMRQAMRELETALRENESAKACFTLADGVEKPAHDVTLTHPFYMGKFTVTQEQYEVVMGKNPSNNQTNKDNPVEQVSWDDAQDFCKKVSAQTKQTVRLPTEAEWEYSCRAGTRTMYHSGYTWQDLNRVAWFAGNSKVATHPVGQKQGNAFGLFDMHGNVYQWCSDYWDGQQYYAHSPAENPQGPQFPGENVSSRSQVPIQVPVQVGQVLGRCLVMRGGSYRSRLQECRSASRLASFNSSPSGLRAFDDEIGFRIVVELDSK